MAFVTVFGLATPSSAQPAPKNADPPIAFAAPPSAQSANAQIVDVKKKKKSAPTPRLDRSTAAMAPPPAPSDTAAARQLPSPLTPLSTILHHNDTSTHL